MITAEQTIASLIDDEQEYELGRYVNQFDREEVKTLMRAFAKTCCIEQAKVISENADYGIYQNDDGQEPYHHESNIYIDKKSILNAYSLDLIK